MTRQHDWLKRPFAHRGLHDAGKGIVENTVSAVNAAIAGGYGIEVDLRLARCGTVMVFHDAALSRLTLADGRVSQRTADELKAIEFRNTGDRMLDLTTLFDLVAGRVPLLLELKSGAGAPPDIIGRLVDGVIAHAATYAGPFAAMSFDPRPIERLRQQAPQIVRGLVAEAFSFSAAESDIPAGQRLAAAWLTSFPRNRPDFIAYDVNALPAIAPLIARHLFDRPLLTWTVRTPVQRQRARRFADAMIFEGFLP